MESKLNILYEDASVLSIAKPAGWIVIRGGEPQERTLREQVAEYLSVHSQRPYIVHRLDRGTSGVMLFAKSAEAHRALNLAFRRRQVAKRYIALVTGDVKESGDIRIPLHTARRGKMRPAHAGEKGLPSSTRWKVLENFSGFSLLELEPRTGRQHQIRVHLKAIGHPLAVDPLYGRKQALSASDLNPSAPPEPVLTRTPLHAAWIEVAHPSGEGLLAVEAPLPEDMERALNHLRQATR